MNNIHFQSKSGIWETPAELFQRLDNEFSFTLDVCALPENAKCDHYFSPEADGLAQEWIGTCWMNPPYGSEIGKWMQKASDAARLHGRLPRSRANRHRVVAQIRGPWRGAIPSRAFEI